MKRNILSYFIISTIFAIFIAVCIIPTGAWFFEKKYVRDRDIRFASVDVLPYNTISQTAYNNESIRLCNVFFENVGTLACAVRARTCVEWNDNLPMEEVVEIGSDWVERSDGYYYYNRLLDVGEFTTVFVKAVRFNNHNKSGSYKVPVYVECAQVKNDVYKQIFDVGDMYD